MNTNSYSIFGAAISELLENKAPLIKSLIIPFITASLLLYLKDLSTLIIFDIVFLFIAIYLFISMAITIHRIILLGTRSIPPWGLSQLGFREIWYALHAAGLCGFLFVLFKYCWPYILSVISTPNIGVWSIAITIVATFVSVLWVYSRFSLVLPGIAVNQGVSFSLSWEMTRNHQILTLLAAAVFPVTLSIVISATSLFLLLLPFGKLISNILFIVTCLLCIAMLSIAYRIIYTEHFKRPLV